MPFGKGSPYHSLVLMDELSKILVDSNYQEIKEWIRVVPEVLTETDYFDESILSYAISLSSYEVIELLLNSGATARYEPVIGYSCLHSAIERDDPSKDKIIKLLVKFGADLDVHGINDWTPLHMAAAKGDVEMIQLLIDLGADVTVKTRIDNYTTPEQEARDLGQIKAAEFLSKLT